MSAVFHSEASSTGRARTPELSDRAIWIADVELVTHEDTCFALFFLKSLTPLEAR
jgi:hypothetical protein